MILDEVLDVTPGLIKYSFIDQDFDTSKVNIYTICSIDAHGLTSECSTQIGVVYDILLDKLIIDTISDAGAPIEYPNILIPRKTKTTFTEISYNSLESKFKFRVDNDDTTANLSKGGWTHLAFIRRGEMGYVYEDGRLRKYFDDTTNYTNSGANLRIGGLSLGSGIEDNSYPADQTKFALFKTGGIAPSEQELRKIVIEERKFFGTNVKCTLHGDSDYQIPAVACDTASDTVHVGTGSGRSEFDGLLRINNTTDAITVAVSASNGLVAEE